MDFESDNVLFLDSVFLFRRPEATLVDDALAFLSCEELVTVVLLAELAITEEYSENEREPGEKLHECSKSDFLLSFRLFPVSIPKRVT